MCAVCRMIFLSPPLVYNFDLSAPRRSFRSLVSKSLTGRRILVFRPSAYASQRAGACLFPRGIVPKPGAVYVSRLSYSAEKEGKRMIPRVIYIITWLTVATLIAIFGPMLRRRGDKDKTKPAKKFKPNACYDLCRLYNPASEKCASSCGLT
jgi:hypothetical protein